MLSIMLTYKELEIPTKLYNSTDEKALADSDLYASTKKLRINIKPQMAAVMENPQPFKHCVFH